MNKAKTCDIVVVGAGPAGVTAAYILARKGLDVRLYDKQLFPRSKLCAGLLTQKTITLISKIFNTSLDQIKKNGIINHACSEYRIFYQDDELIRGKLDFPFHFTDRKIYDFSWIHAAQEAGVQFYPGIAVKNIDPNSATITLADDHIVRAHAVIAADGVWSRIRNTLFKTSRHKKRWRSQMAMTIETRLPYTSQCYLPSYASLHFGFVPWGYAWSFPHASDQVLGIGGLPRPRTRSLHTGFNHFIKSLNLKCTDMQAWQSYPLPYGNYQNPPGRGKILLTGDACGLADPLLGEGIYYAHRSGQIAAESILAYFPHCDNAAAQYGKILRQHLIQELRWIKFYRNLLFLGGQRRRFRIFKHFFQNRRKKMEAAIQGRMPFKRLLLP